MTEGAVLACGSLKAVGQQQPGRHRYDSNTGGEAERLGREWRRTTVRKKGKLSKH
jgi:hypothetical protein